MSVEVISGADPLVGARVLAEAFADEPATRWICGDRPQARGRWFAATLRTHASLPGAVSHLAEVAGSPAGAAVVTPARTGPGPVAQLVWTARVGLGCGPTAVRRTLAYLDAGAAPADAATLELVGVVPGRRGGGVGRALLEQVIAHAAGTPLHLSTADPANVGLYRRFGWRETGRLPVGDLAVTTMLRPGQRA